MAGSKIGHFAEYLACRFMPFYSNVRNIPHLNTLPNSILRQNGTEYARWAVPEGGIPNMSLNCTMACKEGPGLNRNARLFCLQGPAWLAERFATARTLRCALGCDTHGLKGILSCAQRAFHKCIPQVPSTSAFHKCCQVADARHTT